MNKWLSDEQIRQLQERITGWQKYVTGFEELDDELVALFNRAREAHRLRRALVILEEELEETEHGQVFAPARIREILRGQK